ncbi:putative ribonuclease H-like domain-containing protein [Tanacetum coccineum]
MKKCLWGRKDVMMPLLLKTMVSDSEEGNMCLQTNNAKKIVKPSIAKTMIEIDGGYVNCEGTKGGKIIEKNTTLKLYDPFRCLFPFFTTIDHLGKFDGKADKGFFVGYSLNSKAFRVFNSRTRIVEENLHIRFSESTPNVVGPKSSYDDGFKPSSDDRNKVDEDPKKEGNDQEKEDNVNSTNNVNAASTNEVNVVGGKTSIKLPLNPNMPKLEDYIIFEDDENVGAEADMNNLDTTIQVSPILTTRVHKDHPLNQVIGDLQQSTTTSQEVKEYGGTGFVIHALKDLSWIELCPDEFYHLKLQEFWTLIKEEVHVCQPPRFEDPDFPDRVYKVEKALYGLHQAPRAWYETLSTYILDNGFQRGKVDKTLFIKRHKEIWVYISQDYKHTNGNSKASAQDEDGEELHVHMYRSMIGSLMYLTSSRPDIMFAVYAYTRYQTNPKVSHLHAMKRIFRYLKGQPKLGLWYPKDSPFDLVAYIDTDYAGASLDRKSTTGGCQFLRFRLISWQCKKQIVVVNSITEAEYVAASSYCGQLYLILLGKAKKSVRLMMEELCKNRQSDLAKTINGEVQLQALVDGKKIIITESTVRRDLQLEDAEGVDCLPNATIFEQLALMGYEQVGSTERLASPKPSTPRSCLRWSPTGRIFNLKGKIIANSESVCQFDCSKGDNACTSNPQEPISKRFPNSTFFMIGCQNWFDTLLIPLLSEYKLKDKENHGDSECDI